MGIFCAKPQGENSKVQLTIVTPSYIHSQQRAQFARYSLASLRKVVGETYPHIVVDDLPKPGSTWYGVGKEIYNKPNITYIQRLKRLGGTAALLSAVRKAHEQGSDLSFIHLDDNVYVSELEQLLKHSCDAFERDKELVQIRLVGYPLIGRAHNFQLGNLTHISVDPGQVSFRGVHLTPTRQQDYTLWWTRFQDGVLKSRCWPVVLWLSVYRAKFLEELLARSNIALGLVELYYRNENNWGEQQLSKKLGFVNMQFGGLEIHRNKNWREIVSLPNTPVK